MKYYHTLGFKRLNREWRKKLAASGFVDLEDENEKLQQKDTRTIGWENRARISDHYSAINQFLQSNRAIPLRDRYILELYSRGTWLTSIAWELSLCYSLIRRTIAKYKAQW